MIEARGLARTFRTRRGPVEAVRGVDLSVAPGEIVGFLGPNGAGKTTTLRMLTTLLDPTAGSATVAGCDLRADPAGVRLRIGYVAQDGGTDQSARVMEELLLQADLYRIESHEGQKRAEQLCVQLELSGLESRLVKTLSGGQKRRLDIALGLVHHPPLVFLDEPTAGLDPHSRGNMWEHIRRLRKDLNTTIFLTTHYLEEADALCDRILIIDHGKIVAQGTPDELKRRISGDVVTVETSDPTAAKNALANREGVRDTAIADGTLRLTVDHGEKVILTILRALDAAGVNLAAIRVARPSLDDVFLTVTGRSLREETEK